MNIDSTQEILNASIQENGHWRVYIDGKMIAEVLLPEKTDASFIESWCQHVRNNVAAMRPSDSELAARRDRNRKHGLGNDSDTVRSGGDGSPSSDSLGSGEPVPVRAFEEDPEGFAIERWEHYSRRATELEKELAETKKLYRKWEAIAAAAQEIEENT